MSQTIEKGKWGGPQLTADELYEDDKPAPAEADKEAVADPAKEAPEAEAEKEYTESEEKVEADKEADAKAEDKDDTKAEKKSDDRTVPYKRLSKEVAKRRAAEAKAKETEERLAALEKKLTPDLTVDKNAVNKDADAVKKPNPEDYDLKEYDPKYLEDRDAWVLAEAEKRAEAKIEEKRVREAQDQQSKAHAERVAAFIDAAQKYEDFDEAWESAELSRISPTLGQAFLEDPANGVEAAKHLADNEDALDALLAKTPTQQVAWFGRFTAQKEAEAKAVKQNKSSQVGATRVPRNSASGKKSGVRKFGEMYTPEELYGD